MIWPVKAWNVFNFFFLFLYSHWRAILDFEGLFLMMMTEDAECCFIDDVTLTVEEMVFFLTICWRTAIKWLVIIHEIELKSALKFFPPVFSCGVRLFVSNPVLPGEERNRNRLNFLLVKLVRLAWSVEFDEFLQFVDTIRLILASRIIGHC
jgi:hypothetical protein